MKTYIKIEDLKEGWLYEIDGRCASLGIWSVLKDNKFFIVSRYKYGDNFPFGEWHYDSDEGTAKPLKEIEEVPIEVSYDNVAEILAYLNAKREELNENSERNK